MKRWHIFFVVAILAAALFYLGAQHPTTLQQAAESGDLVRIHILAHDDTQGEQSLKLEVRDAILSYFTPLLEDAGSAKEAASIVEESQGDALRVAKQVVDERGYDHAVTVSFGFYDFPDRIYDGQVVPAGAYTALRIGIGDAAGKNWWCVMYPPLCFKGEDVTGMADVHFESSIEKWIKHWKQKAKEGKE